MANTRRYITQRRLRNLLKKMQRTLIQPVYAYKAQCGACLSHNTAGRLHELKMPVLIAAGAKDLFMNIEKTMELVHGISQAEFYLAPEGGHVHQWEYPEPYDSVVVGFLMKHTN